MRCAEAPYVDDDCFTKPSPCSAGELVGFRYRRHSHTITPARIPINAITPTARPAMAPGGRPVGSAFAVTVTVSPFGPTDKVREADPVNVRPAEVSTVPGELLVPLAESGELIAEVRGGLLAALKAALPLGGDEETGGSLEKVSGAAELGAAVSSSGRAVEAGELPESDLTLSAVCVGASLTLESWAGKPILVGTLSTFGRSCCCLLLLLRDC